MNTQICHTTITSNNVRYLSPEEQTLRGTQFQDWQITTDRSLHVKPTKSAENLSYVIPRAKQINLGTKIIGKLFELSDVALWRYRASIEVQGLNYTRSK